MDLSDSKHQVAYLEDKPLSQLKGLTTSDIISYFKKKARDLDKQKRHQLRQIILSDQTMAKTKTISVQLHVRHFHLDYPFQDSSEAFFLSSCHQYHTCHIKYIAQQIASDGKITCSQCNSSCFNTKQILPDALIMSLFEQSSHYSGTKAIFKRKVIRNSQAEQIIQAKSYNERQTLIYCKNNGLQNWQMILIEIWQFVKDERLSALSLETLTESLNLAKNKNSQRYQKALRFVKTPIVCNLICSFSQVRIRNPLVHKDCSPQGHGNKLVLFSFEHVYFDLFQNQQAKNAKIKCIFQSCQNYFDRNNFGEVGLVLPTLHHRSYIEDNQNILSLYFASSFSQNWYLRLGQAAIENQLTNGNNIKEVWNQWKMRLSDLVATTSLREGAARARKIQKKIAKQKEDLSAGQLAEDIHRLVLKSDNIFCPVRCFKCSNLDAIDALDLVLFLHKQQPLRKCPICGHQFKKKQFYECFYLDSQLASFIFANGPAAELLYDVSNAIYLHQLSNFTGETLKDYLRRTQRISQQRAVNECDLVPPLGKRFVVVADRRCVKESGNVNLMSHAIMLEQQARVRDQLTCPSCRRILRLNMLVHLQVVEMLLALKNNNLRLQGTAITAHKQLISTVRYYKDIQQVYQPPQRTLTLYWLSYQLQPIRYPFVFKGCKHTFETTICDFADLQYQFRNQGATRFKCRYRECNRQYELADEMARVDLPVYELVNADRSVQRQMVVKKRYWLKVDLPDTVSLFPDLGLQRREEEEKYRTKLGFQQQKSRELDTIEKRIEQLSSLISSNSIDQQYSSAQTSQLVSKLQMLKEQKKYIQKLLLTGSVKTSNNPQIQNIMRHYPAQSKRLHSKSKQPERLQSKVDYTGIKTHGNLHLFNFFMTPSYMEPQLHQEFNSYRSS